MQQASPGISSPWLNHYRCLAILLLLLSVEPSPAIGQEPSAVFNKEPSAAVNKDSSAPIIYKGGERQQAAEFALRSDDETNWLDEQDDRALSVYRTQRTARSQGVFLLVGGRGAAFSQNALLNTLRMELPRLGWHTLAVGLPDRPQLRLPDRNATGSMEQAEGSDIQPSEDDNPLKGDESQAQNDGGENKGDDSDNTRADRASYRVYNTDKLDSDQRRIEKRLGSALTLARQKAKGGPLVVLGVGEGAAWVGWLARSENAPLRDPIVLVNFSSTARYIPDNPTISLITAMTTPGLILQEHPFGWSRDDLLNENIELRVLPRGNAMHDQRLLRIIRGWLKRRLDS
ncbi:MAG: alpha/beta hydrolase family protein [Pseudomonadales bacterium]|nr:alpha/beta hydrolase family protein [Pseudomonadales bacterium]